MYCERLLFCRSSVRSIRRILSPRQSGVVGLCSWWAFVYLGQPSVSCSFRLTWIDPVSAYGICFPFEDVISSPARVFVSLVLPFVACLPFGPSAVLLSSF
ncbi:unnamed protein product [Microthlaspi erraticum]|uniref:Uncharacterized protein n=1 Tax=Microthlaspi erraticum TaxID=1685480 RepID=A0A6D2HQY3_9BRAS|nr:unnamed protein product [Microthlaspi erraticum]